MMSVDNFGCHTVRVLLTGQVEARIQDTVKLVVTVWFYFWVLLCLISFHICFCASAVLFLLL
jgi:hypothetical protein